MGSSIYPARYLAANRQAVKQINVVMQIDGSDRYFSTFPTYKRVVYGDPNIYYDMPGLVYGGLLARDDVYPWLMVDQSLSISQKIEPESGKASVSIFSVKLIDKDGYVSKLVSPGVLVDEILGGRDVRVWIGYVGTAFPEDYVTVFRATISKVLVKAGSVFLTLSDANMRRRSKIVPEKSSLSAGIDNVVTTIPINGSRGFFKYAQGPDGSYDYKTYPFRTELDGAVSCYIRVDDEYMLFGPGGLTTSSVTVQRGGEFCRSTEVVAHEKDATVCSAVQLAGNAIDLALKLMLSGFAGPWKTGVGCAALGYIDGTGALKNAIEFSRDSKDEWGLTVGDYITISGSTLGNNKTVKITAFGARPEDEDRKNILVYVDSALVFEDGEDISLAFRSKYDTFPADLGLRIQPNEVDIEGFENYRDQFFAGTENTLRLLITEQITGKEWIEEKLLKPLGAYSLTRYGRLSMGYTRPPVPGYQLVTLNADNVLDPAAITIERALTTRRFFNDIVYEYDVDDGGVSHSVLRTLDSESLTRTRTPVVLTIKGDGVKSEFGGAILADRRSRALLSRYKKGAFEISLTVNWQAGSVIESGDVVLLEDLGGLKITNFATGERDIGRCLCEVVDRQVDIRNGKVALKLISGLDMNLSDRYGTVAPSSIVAAGSSRTAIKIGDSFGAKFPGEEWKKWADLVGSTLRVHSEDFVRSGVCRLAGFADDDPNILKLDSEHSLDFDPQAGDIVNIVEYPSETDPAIEGAAKLLYAYVSPTLSVVEGINATSFKVSLADAAKVKVGAYVTVHDDDYSVDGGSDGVKVTGVDGQTITIAESLWFTPAVGQFVELVGFADASGAYRLL